MDKRIAIPTPHFAVRTIGIWSVTRPEKSMYFNALERRPVKAAITARKGDLALLIEGKGSPKDEILNSSGVGSDNWRRNTFGADWCADQ
jgi:hypothetical protein